MDNYYKKPIQLFLNNGSNINGYLNVFAGSRMIDMFNAKSDKEQFLIIHQAKILLANSRVLTVPWILVNRQSVIDVDDSE
ncbi:MAG: hypothetical protein HZA78_12095 [Candidatus Schekmanbacteria bacterium]|nr:hypothetical protein [Candidatus Schekmanbacteria bacterium]